MRLLLAAAVAATLVALVNGQAAPKGHVDAGVPRAKDGRTCLWSEGPMLCGEKKFDGKFTLWEIDANTKNDFMGWGRFGADGHIQASDVKEKTWCTTTGTDADGVTDKNGKKVAANYIEPRINICHMCCKDPQTQKPMKHCYRKGFKSIQVRHDGALAVKGIDLSSPRHCPVETRK